MMSKAITRVAPSRSDRGFTLIEMAVVIAIIAVLTVIAMPSYTIFVAGQRIKSASFDLMSMFILARSEAIKRNAPVTATPTNNDWSQGWTIKDDDGTVLSQQGALTGITLACKQGGSAAACSSLTYNLNGRIAGSVQSIQIGSSAIPESASATYVRCISLNLSGRPASKKGNC